MAKRIGLVIYGLSIIDGDNNRLGVNKLYNDMSLLEIVKKYAEDNISYIQDKEREAVFQFETVEHEIIQNQAEQKECDILYGRIKTGEYGVESELVHVETEEVYTRTPKQADLMPFGFCLAVPSGAITRAVIILQTHGANGIKTAMQKRLEECLSAVNPELQLLFSTLAPKAYMDRFFENGVLQKIRMIRHEIPEDASNRTDTDYGVKHTKEERILHKPLGLPENVKKRFTEFFAGQRSHTEIIEIEDFKYDDLKLEFSLGKANKTFNIGNLESIIISEDITEIITRESGHPTFDSLKDAMKSMSRDYLKGMGLIAINE